MQRKRSKHPRCLTPHCPGKPFRRKVCKQCYWQARKFVKTQGITMEQLAEQKVVGQLQKAADFRREHFWKAVQRIKEGKVSK